MTPAGWNRGQGRGTGSKDSFTEWVSKDDQDVITQEQDKAIPSQNSGAQMNARKLRYVQETARPGLNGAGATAREACSGPSEPGRTGPGAPRGRTRSHLI